jgi:hypothetical protein
MVLLATVAQFILGALWYSPFMFGKWWMEIMGATTLSADEIKRMQKEMAPFYLLQIVLTLVSTWVFALLVFYFRDPQISLGSYGVAGLIWLGFIVPMQISSVIWGNTKKQFWPKQIFVMISYQLVGIMITGFLFSL